MALRGKLSDAHEYDESQQCIYCGMLEWNVKALSHVCTAERERLSDLGELVVKKVAHDKREQKEPEKVHEHVPTTINVVKAIEFAKEFTHGK